MKLKTRLWSIVILTSVLGIIAPAAYGESSNDPTQNQVDAVLAQFPEGTQTGPGEVSWDGGQVVLTIISSEAQARSVGSCSSGWFCAYTGSALSGSRLAFSSCSGTNSLAAIGNAPRSIANARSSGTVRAYSPVGAVASVGANSYINISLSATRLGC